jgi:hypothetical protein
MMRSYRAIYFIWLDLVPRLPVYNFLFGVLYSLAVVVLYSTHLLIHHRDSHVIRVDNLNPDLDPQQF